nr:2-dehydro-3-deoxygalactonokinase [uncultured Cohaesibacter sp.]
MLQKLIIVDWGTTSFRAWLLDADTGVVLAEISQGKGMRALQRSEFADYARSQLDGWRLNDAEVIPVYLAGMVGAPQGWQQAPQPPLPMRGEELVRDIVPVEGMADTYIIPGVRQAGRPQDADVIRGEEVQIFGAMALLGRQSGLVCLPGTHSKWCEMREGVFTRFHSSMTGEVYDVMSQHSILSLMADTGAPFDADGFDKGLEQIEGEGGLLNHLFKARARVLYGDLEQSQTASFLSGMLIGSEIKAMRSLYDCSEGEVLLVCADRLAKPYEHALTRKGVACRHISSREATLAGVRALAQLHGAIRQER